MFARVFSMPRYQVIPTAAHPTTLVGTCRARRCSLLILTRSSNSSAVTVETSGRDDHSSGSPQPSTTLKPEHVQEQEPAVASTATSSTSVQSQKAADHALPDSDPEERRKLWIKAIKPPMYSVGFMPVLVAAAVVYTEYGLLPWLRCSGLVLASICIIAWLNLSNDAFDAATGVDKTKRESVVNLTGNRNLVLLVANVFLLAGVGLLLTLVTANGDMRPVMMLTAAIACGYVYQGPPFRLSYKGMGEPLCFVAFGPLALPAFYLAQLPAQPVAAAATAVVPPLVWLLAGLVGLTTTIILFCSHFHQIEGDKAAGKMSPLVRLGTEKAVKVLRVATGAPFLGVVAAVVLGLILGANPTVSHGSGAVVAPWTLMPALLLSVPAAMSLLSFAETNHTVPAAIAPLKIFATKLHIAFGMTLISGLALSRCFV
ncbi:hypothetical protein CEUSTIGMA_g7396.t1 [Chlamydomonas eustigma]|uniref:Uncharacterized protein n=1 Tax=Chlamydomonas eustigma TaxID=1157962 RepID=A0A250XA60_9CHLO|nr:hypothetical protein CEUSTIGMA_g7396.t1 [Chlamydomonas eustigma]|eukprot:GAX79957.1 hypothetical protein CEUSTIGMA_g7396.t1 [Chlamydomonas eustigma]